MVIQTTCSERHDVNFREVSGLHVTVTGIVCMHTYVLASNGGSSKNLTPHHTKLRSYLIWAGHLSSVLLSHSAG